jgi:hypothetical protein
MIAAPPLSEFSVLSHLSIVSAFHIQRPEKILLHCHTPPHGPWWEATVRLCGPTLSVHLVPALHSIFGRPLAHYAHKSDVVRLQALLAHGGIYLDLDIILTQNLDALRIFPTLLAEESIAPGALNLVTHTLGDGYGDLSSRARGVSGLANAVILAVPQSPFLQRWYDAYRSFDGTQWDYHSCKLPLLLHQSHPGEAVTLAASGFFLPQAEDMPAFLALHCTDLHPFPLPPSRRPLQT